MWLGERYRPRHYNGISLIIMVSIVARSDGVVDRNSEKLILQQAVFLCYRRTIDTLPCFRCCYRSRAGSTQDSRSICQTCYW